MMAMVESCFCHAIFCNFTIYILNFFSIYANTFIIIIVVITNVNFYCFFVVIIDSVNVFRGKKSARFVFTCIRRGSTTRFAIAVLQIITIFFAFIITITMIIIIIITNLNDLKIRCLLITFIDRKN